MNALVAFAFLVVAVSGCPEPPPPVECAATDLVCPGGVDPEGCPMPDLCIPSSGVDNDGHPCAAHCPMECGDGLMMCPGEVDPNGCMMPDMCVPEDMACHPPM